MWKGGLTSYTEQVKNSLEFRLWREAVFARDNWTCQKCRRRGGDGKAIYLHSHHIKSFSKYPDLRFAIDNGITFCRDCHNKFHKLFGRGEKSGEEKLKDYLIINWGG